MPVTVSVNQLAVSHKGSSGFCMGFPDVCQTPSPPIAGAIPYPNIGKAADSSKAASKTKASRGSIVQRSSYTKVVGDEAGTLYGITDHGALVTPEAPQGVRIHQSDKDLQNLRKRLPTREPVAAPKPLAAGAQPTPINRVVLLHAIAKRG